MLRGEKLGQIKISSYVMLLNLDIDTEQDWKGQGAEFSNREGQGKHDLQNISL